jgi:hypothetical protein
MKAGRFALKFGCSLAGVLLLTSVSPAPALAQDHDAHMTASQHQPQTAEQKKQANALVQTIRDVTERFRDVSVAQGEGYGLVFGCVSGGDYGAMGLHFVNFPLVLDGKIDATTPEIVLYEATSNGRLKITGADFLVLAADWDKTHTSAPELNGQLFHYFEAPNRFGLPPFYTLHVWAWKDNPNGTFTNWNPNVSCDGYNPPTPENAE